MNPSTLHQTLNAGLTMPTTDLAQEFRVSLKKLKETDDVNTFAAYLYERCCQYIGPNFGEWAERVIASGIVAVAHRKFIRQSSFQCELCSGEEDGMDFDYCRACGFSKGGQPNA